MRGRRPWEQFLRYCTKLENTPGSDLAAAIAEDPSYIAELAAMPAAELDKGSNAAVSSRGFTMLHELVSTLVDQVVDLRLVTESYVRSQVTFDGPIGGKRYVQRPDSPVEQAKQMQKARAVEGLDDWYDNLMKGVN